MHTLAYHAPWLLALGVLAWIAFSRKRGKTG
jgi:hypothetical protein